MNIAVLCGGLSAERDVSVTGAAMISAALRRCGHKTAVVDLFLGCDTPYSDLNEVFTLGVTGKPPGIGETVPDLNELRRSRSDSVRVGDGVVDVCRKADIVFTALHGEDGEDGKIQALLDLYGVKFTGTGMTGSVLAMNKAVAKQLFRQNGIKTPLGRVVIGGDISRAGELFDICRQEYGLPLAVKPCCGGSSVGASVVRTSDEFAGALMHALRYGGEALVEEYISGRECSVGVIRDKALPVIEICSESGFFDYKNKYQHGMAREICPADLPADITEALQKAAEQVFKVLRFEVYGRMDFIVKDTGDIYCLEGNALPGMTDSSLLPREAAAAGISYDELCELIVYESLKKYESEKR